jgi:two-component system sensor histidine kinase DesK
VNGAVIVTTLETAVTTSDPIRTPELSFDVHDRPGFALVYLIFVFLPLLFVPHGALRALLPTLPIVALFLPLHFAFYRRRRDATPLPWILAVAALGYALIPFNPGGNTFLIYAVAMAATSLPPRSAMRLGAVLGLLMAAEFLWTLPTARLAGAYSGITVALGAIVMTGIVFSRARAREHAALRLTQDEVRRLAGLAERERIARDLHDLLGHTLSVVALKSELAGKLIGRDPDAARSQIRDVETVAREALAQVREAVAGIRAADLQAELASARLALLAADVRLDQRLQPVEIAADAAQVLALALREAVTNILRHAQARRVEVELASENGELRLSIADDGRGGVEHAGHGLTGMRERLSAVGGSLEIESERGSGTRLVLRVPRAAEGAT